jgi:hypothetical protein
MMCLSRAAELLDVVSRQDGTNPTYPDLLEPTVGIGGREHPHGEEIELLFELRQGVH